jgi:hypothetical protein
VWRRLREQKRRQLLWTGSVGLVVGGAFLWLTTHRWVILLLWVGSMGSSVAVAFAFVAHLLKSGRISDKG